jgi:hypothetical protein
MGQSDILRFDGAAKKDPAIGAWLQGLSPELREIAERWFPVMRECGDEVLELFHDNWAVACFGDAPFAYIGAYRAHVNIGFFQGASLPDPQRLLEGSGKYMRHVKLRPGTPVKKTALTALIEAAFWDMKSRVERG